MSIGSQLRQAREAQELSLDQAAQVTHIRLHYLVALEADQFDKLPSRAQVRGFIRAYADFLKLDSNELIQALDGDWKGEASIPVTLPVTANISPELTSSDTIFKEIGLKLRSQRELMSLSLGDVERHTHIRMHYVQALEDGDISHLPSPVQGRGMLSNYASFLGLNTEEVLLRFADGLQSSLYDRQAARNPNPTKPRQEEAGRIPARPSQMRRLFSMDLFIGGLLVVFLLGFGIWGALRISALNSSQVASPTAPPVSEILISTSDATLSASTTITPTQLLIAITTQVLDASLVPATTPVFLTETPIVFEPTPVMINAPLQINIVARQRAWMRVIVDGEVAYEGRVMPGSAYSFPGNERIELLTGNGAGMQVFFNQQDLGVLGAFGEIVERIFSIEGVQTPTPSILPTSTPVPTSTQTPLGTPGITNTPASPTATPKP
jgi:cytoskeleton protein RodZ